MQPQANEKSNYEEIKKMVVDILKLMMAKSHSGSLKNEEMQQTLIMDQKLLLKQFRIHWYPNRL